MRKKHICRNNTAKKRKKELLCLLLACLLLMTGCREKTEVISALQQYAEEESSEDRTNDGEGTAEGSFPVSEAQGGKEEPHQTASDTEGSDRETSEGEAAVVFVYICGQVLNPGVYELPKGSRICDAAEAAGGFTEEASRDSRNLAELLYDGEMVYIPTEEEAREQGGFPAESTPAQPNELQPEEESRVNLNRADREELMTLSGIGESRADAIIAYRDKNGGFSDVEQIMEIPGIGSSLFEKIREQITVK